MCRAIYNSNGEVAIQEYDYNISYIVYFLYNTLIRRDIDTIKP
jgi:hypothetical protein